MANKFPSIFLDTNVLWTDNGKNPFQDKYIKGLQVYRDITKAKIYTSEAFALELYYQESQRIKTISKELSKIRQRYTSYEFPVLDADKLIAEYQKGIEKFFSKIIPARVVDIKECVRRAVEKIAPCTQSSEEFRDTVGRLSYIGILKNEECIFVSKDGHFDKCGGDHEKARIYKDLHGFFKEFNEEFLKIKIGEAEFFEKFPLSEIEQHLEYKTIEADSIGKFIDIGNTDYEVRILDDVDHAFTDIICTDYDNESGIYTFSFVIGFSCKFKIFDEQGKDISESFLEDESVNEYINGTFTVKEGKIEIDTNSITNDIESISLVDIMEDYRADQAYDIWRGK